MKIIQCLADIETLKVHGNVPMWLIKEVERDFLNIYESEFDGVYLMDYRLSSWQALFVLEKGDDVLGKLNHPFELEYVELIKTEELSYYRCAIRNDHEFQLYYSIIGIHDEETEMFLEEQAR